MTTLLPIALGLLLQSTALLGLGLLALRLARRRGPAVQSLVGRATLAGVGLALLLAAPLTSHVRPLWRVTLPAPSVPPAPISTEEPTPAPKSGGGNVQTPLVVSSAPIALPSAPLSSPAPPELGAGGRSFPAPALSPAPSLTLGRSAFAPRPDPLHLAYPTLAAVWGLGTALLLLWLGVCQCHLTRLHRHASPVTAGPAAEILATLTTRPPALLTHPSVRSPFLAGIRRPAIFLPMTYETDFDPTALRAILTHELAHLARRDNAWTLAARLLSALLWPQPLLWVLCRRLEQTGEEACDQAVLAQDCPPRAYADCLLTLAERHPLGRRERALGAGVAPFRSSLGQRIGRILDKGTHAMSAVTPRLRLTIAALAVAAALGGAFLVSSAPAQSPPQPPVPATVTLTPEQQRLNAARSQDMSNLKQIGLALTQYAQDHDEFFPNAAHWMDALSPYLKDKTVFYDPFQPGAHHYGYALNRNCSGKSLAAFPYPAETVFVFDSTLGTRNASDTGQSLRKITGPYGAGSNYVFVDGHIKWFRTYRPPFALNQRMSRPHANKGYTVQSYIGAAPIGPARVISEADMAARRNFLNSFTPPDQALSSARFLAGLTPVQGPGVVVTLNDSKQHLPKNMPSGMTPPNIIHDTDINAVVNELKAAGAEAVAVNDQRLVATSSVRVAGPTVLINFIPVVPPFVIKAIGNPTTLAGAMTIPGGIATQLKAYDPSMFSVREAAALKLPAYSGNSEPRYAKPASGTPTDDAPESTTEADRSQILIQQRDGLEAQLHALNAQADALTVYIQAMRARALQGVKKLPSPSTNTQDAMRAERQTLASQLAAAQADLNRKEASSMTSQHPAVIEARQKVEALQKAYQELPIREKQEFVKQVHLYNRRQVALLNTWADTGKPEMDQLINVRREQAQLQAEIARLDAWIVHISR